MANIINGTAGADALNGLSGDNVISGLAGSDKLNGGAGLDTLDGGSGSDTISGNSGDDALIYRAAENTGSADVYDGGSGKDYLQLNLTLTEWNSAAVQADVANYLNFLIVNTNSHTLEATNNEFHFTAFNLTASKIETLRVVVDGVALTPEDNLVALGTDGVNAGENTAGVSSNLLANDLVLDQVKTFSFTQAAHGAVSIVSDFSVVNAPSAIATYTPTGTYWDYLAAGQTATDSFTYTVTDADNDVQTTTVNVTITGTNDAVLITSGPQAGAVVEDADTTPSATDSLNAAGTVAFSDVDLSDNHTVSYAAAPTNTTSLGAFALGAVSEAPNAATGSVGWTYALNNAAAQSLAAGQIATETYTVTVNDGHGSTTTQNVVITITGTNDAPAITAPDLVGGVTEQMIPAGNLSDSGVITFTDVDLNDVHLVSGVGTPVGVALGSLTAVKDSDTTGTGAGGQLTWTYTVADTAVEYLAAGQTKVESFTITLDDQHGGLLTRQIDVTITGTNDAPAITAPDLVGGVTEQVIPAGNLSDSGVITFTDVDLNDVHLVSGVGTPVGVALGSLTAVKDSDTTGTGAGGQLTWTYTVADTAVEYLAAGQTKVESFTITLDDQHGGLLTRQIDVTVTGTNDAPVITLVGSDSAAEGVTEANAGLLTNGHVTVTDVDQGDVATLSVDSVGIGVASTGATAVGLPALQAMMSVDQSGAWHFNSGSEAFNNLAAGQTLVLDYVLKADDGDATDTQTVTVTITGTNDAPVATALADQNSDEDTAFSFTAPASTDVDSASLTYTATQADDSALPAWLHFDATTRTFSGTPPQDFNGVVAVKMVTSDGSLTASETFNLTINPVNDAPVAVADTLAATEDTPVTYTAAQLLGNDTDVDSPTLHIASVTSGTSGTAVLNVDRTVTFTPNANFNGAADFSYTASDGALDSNSATVTVNVAAVNDAPVAVADTLAATEDTPVTYTAAQLLGNDTDVDSPTLHIASVTSGTGGTAVLNLDGTVTFTPNANFNGAADFSYKASDGALDSNSATVTVNVAAVNDAPVAVADTLAATEDTPVTYTAAQLLGNDTDVDSPTLHIASVTSGTGGTAVLNVDGTVTFTPNANFNGAADFSYKASDGALDSNSATVTVNVAPVNDPPVFTSGATGSVAENSAISTVVYDAAVTDVDGAPAQFSLSGTDAGLFNINAATGEVTFKVSPDFEEPADAGGNNVYDFSVNAFDGTATTSQAVAVTVTNVAEDTQGPTSVGFVLAAGGATIDTGSALSAGDAIGTFVAQGDPNSSLFHYALTGANAGLFSFNTTTGALAVGGADLAANATPYALTVTAFDQDNNAVSQDVKVWVGGSGGQSLVGVGTNVDFQYGLNGNDTLTGGAGADALVGGQNNDLLIGGPGADQLFGGSNGDLFRFTSLGDAGDKILDFTTTGGGADAVQLSVPGFSLQNQAGAGAATMPDDTANIGGADIVRWTGSAASMDTAGEVDTFLAGKAGTFAGGVFVLAYDATGHVALYYDDHANAGSTVTLISTFDNLTSTSTFTGSDFIFV